MSSYEEEEIEEGKILLEDFFPLWTDVCYFPPFWKSPSPILQYHPTPACHCPPCTLIWSPSNSSVSPDAGLLWRPPDAAVALWQVDVPGFPLRPLRLWSNVTGTRGRLRVETLGVHSLLDLLCGGQGGSWRKEPESTFQGQVRTPPGLCPTGMPLGDSHLVSGLGEGPIWTAFWNLRLSADVSFLGGLTPSVSTASGPSRVFLAAVPKTVSCAPGEIKQRVTSGFSPW